MIDRKTGDEDGSDHLPRRRLADRFWRSRTPRAVLLLGAAAGSAVFLTRTEDQSCPVENDASGVAAQLTAAYNQLLDDPEVEVQPWAGPEPDVFSAVDLTFEGKAGEVLLRPIGELDQSREIIGLDSFSVYLDADTDGVYEQGFGLVVEGGEWRPAMAQDNNGVVADSAEALRRGALVVSSSLQGVSDC